MQVAAVRVRKVAGSYVISMPMPIMMAAGIQPLDVVMLRSDAGLITVRKA